MTIRSFVIKGCTGRSSRWWDRAALAVIGLTIAAVVIVAVTTVRRHDALIRWRSELERAAGNPPWPAWSSAWPALPVSDPRRKRARQDLRGVYAYAATRPHVLAQILCFCGCAARGHSSLLNCFVADFRRDGTPTWTDHSFDCEICVHIAGEVMLMEAQGLGVEQIVRNRLTVFTRPCSHANRGSESSGRKPSVANTGARHPKITDTQLSEKIEIESNSGV